MAKQLYFIGDKVSNANFVITLMESLPKSYHTLVVTFRTISTNGYNSAIATKVSW